ncbi:MAG: queuosine precursor transporter [Archaeoglobaceae archaeon]|nr:queuosine precursor transporter [Archaeoglobaceae archaeon]MCX8152207.1 queuosine precursor transporter [Archaeoglobaceae archaeon]MDW8013993.1 queuosine precursor transporter [Archaeoglobaceae archaeon]
MFEFIALTLITLAAVVLFARNLETAIALYATLTILANLVSFKIVYIGEVGPLILVGPAGVIAYSATFLLTDFLTEVAGKEYAKRAVFAGFLANILTVIVVFEALIQRPFAMSSEEVDAFNKVLGFAPRIILASIVAFIVAQTHDVYAFHFWKKITKNRFLWLRNNASTVVSQAIDTVLFITIAFYGLIPNDVLVAMILTQYLIKVLIALIDTPFMYLSVWIFEKSWKAKFASKT